MADFESRIGPRSSPSQESKSRFIHKTWTRPGYHPPSQSPPKKPRSLRYSDNKNDCTRSSPVPDDHNEPSLLRRMGLGGTSSSPQSENADYSHSSLTRTGVEAIQTNCQNAIVLGNHLVESLPAHEAAARASFGLTGEDRGSEKSPIARRQDPSKVHRSVTSSPGPRHSPNKSPFVKTTSDSSNAPPTAYTDSNPPRRDVWDSNSSWSHLPLKDRIASFVQQNAQLRSNHCHGGGDSHPGGFSIKDRNVDAVLSPVVCNSIVESLRASQVQIIDTRVAQLPTKEIRPPSPSQDINQRPKAKAEVSNSSFGIVVSQPNLKKPSSPQPSVSQASTGLSPSTHTQHRTSNNISPLSSAPDAGPSNASTSLRPQSLPKSTTPPAHNQQKTIPIPILPALFNQNPVLPALDTSAAPASHPMPHQHMKHRGQDHNEHIGTRRRRSPSLNPRPHKYPRTRSPSPTSTRRYYKDNGRFREEERGRPSSARRGRSPSTAVSPVSRSRRTQASRTFRRSRSLASRSRSPSRFARSRSPRRGDPNHRDAHHSATNNRASPPRHHEVGLRYGYTSRDPITMQRDKDPLTSYQSAHNKYAKPIQEPYLFEREQIAKEKARQDQGRQDGPFKQRVGTAIHEEELKKDSSSAGDKSTEDKQTIPPTGVIGPPLAMPTPPTSASITDGSPTPRLIDFRKKLNMGASSNLRSDDSQGHRSTQPPTVGQDIAKAPIDLVMDSPGATPNTDDTTDMRTVVEDFNTWKSSNDIPGIWLLKQGSSGPDVVEEAFEVTKEISQKWQIPSVGEETIAFCQPGTLAELLKASSPKLSWKLKCVPKDFAGRARQFLSRPMASKELVNFFQSQSRWPPGGKLIIEVNPDQTTGRTLYATNLASAPFVELRNHIHSGLNLVRLIQLGDMSNYVFLLYVAPDSDFLESEPGSDLGLPLDDWQSILQKSRTDNPMVSMVSLFGASKASVRLFVGENKVEGDTSSCV